MWGIFGKDAVYYIDKGDAYFHEKLYDKAITEYSKAIELDSTNAAYYSLRGEAYYHKKLYAEAIADYSKAIEFSADNAKYYNNRGYVCCMKGLYDEAIADCNVAIGMDDENAAFYGSRGDAYYFKERYHEAFNDYCRALELGGGKDECTYLEDCLAKAPELAKYSGMDDDFKATMLFKFDEKSALFERIDGSTGKLVRECRYIGGNEFDEMPEGIGEFGLVASNPIPAYGIKGGYEYLDRLMTADGRAIKAERIGSMSAPNISDIIDGYNIFDAKTGAELGKIYICPYNKKNSTKAPKGFILKVM